MIGLPGPRISFKRKETRYGITAIPLGGYCMIAGMERGKDTNDLEKALAFIGYFGEVADVQAERAGEQLGFDLVTALDTLNDWGTVRRFKQGGLYRYTLSEACVDGVKYKEGEQRHYVDLSSYLASERKLLYSSLPWWKRMLILFAGSFFNLVAAVTILLVLLMVGGAQHTTTTIDAVIKDSPAAEAGLMPGDELISADGTQFDTWQDFVSHVQTYDVGDELSLAYQHNGEEKQATIVLADNEGAPLVGLTPRVEKRALGFTEAVQISLGYIGLVASAIVQLFNPFTFADTLSQTSSIVGIAIEANSAASAGPLSFLLLIAALSISIGLMNLLPVPPLDGGKILVETIEKVVRRRIPNIVINLVSMLGFAALMMLFVMATFADFQRYF